MERVNLHLLCIEVTQVEMTADTEHNILNNKNNVQPPNSKHHTQIIWDTEHVDERLISSNRCLASQEENMEIYLCFQSNRELHSFMALNEKADLCKGRASFRDSTSSPRGRPWNADHLIN